MSTPEPDLRWAEVAEDLAAEFPALGLAFVVIPATPGRTPPGLRRRLKDMSNRYSGARAVNLRQEPIPWAYRVFFRQVGIDPDESPTPVEAISLERMRAGEFKSRNLVDDALLCATMDTGVAVFAFDADEVSGAPRLDLTPKNRQLVISDDDGVVAELFGRRDQSIGVTDQTRSIMLCAPRVKGVPEVSVQEALWVASDLLAAGTLGKSAGGDHTSR
ncbi:MAG: hypothetical protein H0V29_08040 [Thermoleophilaceae bacterium]|nr:hypothetical protein [Thermoleophilaceae bacterium]